MMSFCDRADLHVRFLGQRVPATARAYPTTCIVFRTSWSVAKMRIESVGSVGHSRPASHYRRVAPGSGAGSDRCSRHRRSDCHLPSGLRKLVAVHSRVSLPLRRIAEARYNTPARFAKLGEALGCNAPVSARCQPVWRSGCMVTAPPPRPRRQPPQGSAPDLRNLSPRATRLRRHLVDV